MEEKQLDLNQPFLSVRRFSSTVATAEVDNKRQIDNALPKVPRLPVYKSELKSGPVRNPGTVPFVWEKTPGRPKCESKPQIMAHEIPPVVPKLPPGRILNVERQALDRSTERATTAGQSETRNVLLDTNVTKEESSREGMEETDISGSEDDDGIYVDALDTLSRSESFFLNCSVSGVSGLDCPDMKPSGTFSTDPQTRDFMMGRFLPAAKAMASETPPHYTRKQLVAQEQPRKITTVSVQKRHSFDQCKRISNTSNCSQVPGMRKQPQVPISSSHMRKARSSYPSHYDQTVNEDCKDAAQKHLSRGLLETSMNEDKSKLKSESNKSSCRNDNQKLNGSSLYERLQGNGTLPYHDKFSQSGINKEKRFLEIHEKSKNPELAGFNAHVKNAKSFGELLANENVGWETTSASPLVEKTLYIDSVHMLNSQISNSSSSDLKGSIDYCRDDVETVIKNGEIEETTVVDSSPKDMKHFVAVSKKANMPPEILKSTDSCLSSLSERSTNNVQKVVSDIYRHDVSLMGISTISGSTKVDDGKIELGQISGDSEGCNGIMQDLMKIAKTKVADDGKVGIESQVCTKSSNQDTPNGGYSLLLLPPPLPKSPSESWLKRTLPAVSPKHPSLKSFAGMNAYPRVQASKLHSADADPKWETIVKTSNVDNGHLRFSEELLTPIPEV
ncbi:uncharacterized protein LOC105635706 isoform X2 [Jatropha curcas]|uniref:uncharacterized protein LOC105635706 isoform X2 n=1 Tax=Jatropha curcas TaxID=180498 RepID=UPI0005FAB8F8|nr:uncharacterized protein LOC105635706 isoform X2 [Jatropha curcas]